MTVRELNLGFRIPAMQLTAHRVLICALGMLLAAAVVTVEAQTTTGRSEEEREAAWNEHRRDFDYLLGEWEFDAEHAEYGRFRGRWAAIRLAQGQVLDEYRALGDSGETYYVTTTVRNYNADRNRWELVGMDRGGGLQDTGTARRVGSEMHIEQRFGSSIWRIRYYDITANSFSWVAERSVDDGKTWHREFMRIRARRTASPRELAALTTDH